MKFSFILLLSICFALTACERGTPTSKEVSKIQEIERPRFALYKTKNIWTLLLLDTRTGRLWQSQYATDGKAFRGVIPVSTEILANGQDGRFTLTETENIWTFILTDSKNGRLWQCQFSMTKMKDQDRFCIPIDLNEKE